MVCSTYYYLYYYYYYCVLICACLVLPRTMILLEYSVSPWARMGSDPTITVVSGILFPSILLKFSPILTKFRLAYTQFTYSSYDTHLIFDVPSLRYHNSFATIMHFAKYMIFPNGPDGRSL